MIALDEITEASMASNIRRIKEANSIVAGYRPKTQLNIELNRRFCDLPSCKKEYKGSGRYCCKEHFLEHKKIIK